MRKQLSMQADKCIMPSYRNNQHSFTHYKYSVAEKWLSIFEPSATHSRDIKGHRHRHK